MNTKSRRMQLLILAVFLFIPVAFLQSRIDPLYQRNYAASQSKLSEAGRNLPIEFALGAFTGFREAVAGMLWVRCDEFFHTGDYEAVMPLIRVITWLDPHQTDVYQTGAWHMDYNFTDASERSDRRYVPLSLALLNEGIENNPDEPDLYTDMAFVQYFRKIEDFPKATEWFAKGWKVVQSKDLSDPNSTDFLQADKGVMTIGHGLAHAYEYSGQPKEAAVAWNQCIALHRALMKAKPNDYSEKQSLTVAEHELVELEGRLKYRSTDTAVPLNMQFAPQLVRTAPKVFVLKGSLHAIGATKFVLETGQRTFGQIDGCRFEIRLEDAGYHQPIIQTYTLGSRVDPDVTIMQDSASIRGGKINSGVGRTLDMSQDPDMYSFKAPRYTVSIWFTPNNPSNCPIPVQDRIGWLGEGLGPQPGRVISDGKAPLPGETTAIPGLRYLVKTYTLSREDILGKGEKVFN